MRVRWSICACICIWLNYSRKLRRQEEDENFELSSASPIGLGAEITNHRGSSESKTIS
jgi:hypothetical protein